MLPAFQIFVFPIAGAILRLIMRIGPWWIHQYTLKVTSGVLVALFVLWWRAPRLGIARERLLKWVWILAIVAFFCGRVGYAFGNAVYFSDNPAALFRLRQVGGLHGSSALAGGLLVAWIWARLTSVRFRTMLDFLVPAMLCIAAGAWWGCAGVGCAWGREVFVVSGWLRWFVAELPDIYRTIEPRYAVQIIGAVWALMLAVLAVALRESGAMVFGVYLLGTAGLTFLRADVVPQLGSLCSDLIMDLVLAGLVFTSILLDVRNAGSAKLEKL